MHCRNAAGQCNKKPTTWQRRFGARPFLWKGENLLLDAIDQLLNTYVNWRDEKIALIVFNRDVKFSDVLTTATKAIEEHKLCLKALGQRKETSYSFLFPNPDDEKRTIKLELVLFNVA